ncbi:type VI secretion system baseplate subunit TssE [Utexia brackfieldae]|uniref:type VI secretion system baseplate subunit TssE n=1 Tax=Utexia brackfieldae TaxID=3074108 RepID=UPI00370CFF5E
MAALRRWRTDTNKASLFERLRQDNLSATSGKAALIVSIKHNLQRIFNARPGECHGSRELGIIDINDALLGSEEIQHAICYSIQYCIEQYEPRISQVNVTVRQDPLTFAHYFTVMAYLDQLSESDRINIDIHLNDNKLNVI